MSNTYYWTDSQSYIEFEVEFDYTPAERSCSSMEPDYPEVVEIVAVKIGRDGGDISHLLSEEVLDEIEDEIKESRRSEEVFDFYSELDHFP